MVIDVLRVDWNRNVVVLLLQSSESSDHFALLVWLEVSKLRRELHLILVLVGHLPLVLQRDAGLVLNVNLLLRTDAFEDRWEEELGLIRNHKRRLVAVADQGHLLHIGRVVVEYDLGCEIVVPRRLGSKLKAHNSKGLALDQANMGIGTEGLGRVLMNLVVDWRIRGVLNLDSLVNRLSRTTAREVADLGGVQFDHRNERLRARRETVANHSDLKADWRVDVLSHSVVKLALLHAAQQSLRLAKGGFLVLLSSLLLLSNDPLVLRDSAVKRLNKALSSLEEVLVRLVRTELDLEVHTRVGFDFSALRPDFERVLNPLASGSIHDF